MTIDANKIARVSRRQRVGMLVILQGLDHGTVANTGPGQPFRLSTLRLGVIVNPAPIGTITGHMDPPGITKHKFVAPLD